jgi:hypothetical protein
MLMDFALYPSCFLAKAIEISFCDNNFNKISSKISLALFISQVEIT